MWTVDCGMTCRLLVLFSFSWWRLTTSRDRGGGEHVGSFAFAGSNITAVWVKTSSSWVQPPVLALQRNKYAFHLTLRLDIVRWPELPRHAWHHYIREGNSQACSINTCWPWSSSETLPLLQIFIECLPFISQYTMHAVTFRPITHQPNDRIECP
jgi:hypothetical protein